MTNFYGTYNSCGCHSVYEPAPNFHPLSLSVPLMHIFFSFSYSYGEGMRGEKGANEGKKGQITKGGGIISLPWDFQT